MATENLRSVESHFRFGENWKSFNTTIDASRFESARSSLLSLLPEPLHGKSFLDIGSGSGLSSWAALELGAARVDSMDIDPHSVEATTSVLSATSFKNWSARQESIFEFKSDSRYDVVYSWGVLHHTGAMWDAIDRASSFVKPNGHLIMSLYRKTPFCRLWSWEKQWYAQRASGFSRRLAIGAYVALASTVMAATGRNPWRYYKEYRQRRGMSWIHDIHDWLGGYPYESVTPSEVIQHMGSLGFAAVRKPAAPSSWIARLGLFSGCDEFVFRAPV
jgi:SAM-dependent methyltransferase